MKHPLKSLLPTPINGASPDRSFTGFLRCAARCLLVPLLSLFAALSAPAYALTVTGIQTHVACNGGANGAVSVNASGGTPPYSYSWSPAGGSSLYATGLSAGTYTVTVTDGVNTVATRSFTITQPTALSASTSISHVSVNGGSNGSASVSAYGGTPGYMYSWSPSGGSSSTATGLRAGTYTVTVTDYNSCVMTRNVTIVQPPVLSASISATQASAAGASDASATVTASGGWTPYTYSWSPSGGTAATATGLAAGAYSVTVTDGAGIEVTRSVTITAAKAVQAALAVNASTTTPAYGNTATLGTTGGSGSGAVTYASNSSNCTVSGVTLTAAAVGSCTITATKAADATYTAATATVAITVGKANQAALSVSSTNTTLAYGSTATLSTTGGSGTGAVTYASDSANCTVSGVTLTAAAVGSCTITATKAADASYTAATATVAITVGQASHPTGALNDTGQTLCDNGSNVMAACTTATTGDAAAMPRQDGRFGRDVGAPAKVGGGVAGFDFTRVCFNGDLQGAGTCTGTLVANTSGTATGNASTDWACTKDNVTNLVWALESGTGEWTTYAQVTLPAATNSASRCGFSSGWRLPTRRELMGLVHFGASAAPLIDVDYFPSTLSNLYWTAETRSPGSTLVWVVGFDFNGSGYRSSPPGSLAVRLVRSGP